MKYPGYCGLSRFPPLDVALDARLGDEACSMLAEQSRHLPITVVSGVPSWLLVLFERMLQMTGRDRLIDVWPQLQVIVHGGTSFEPYRSLFARIVGCDDGAIPRDLPGLRRLHRRGGSALPVAAADSRSPDFLRVRAGGRAGQTQAHPAHRGGGGARRAVRRGADDVCRLVELRDRRHGLLRTARAAPVALHGHGRATVCRRSASISSARRSSGP